MGFSTSGSKAKEMEMGADSKQNSYYNLDIIIHWMLKEQFKTKHYMSHWYTYQVVSRMARTYIKFWIFI